MFIFNSVYCEEIDLYIANRAICSGDVLPSVGCIGMMKRRTRGAYIHII